MPGALAIRLATPADADAIGEIHVAAHRFAYRGIATDRYLAQLDSGSRAEAWRAYLESPPESLRMWLAEREGAVVGFCGTHAAADDEPGGIPAGGAELHWIHLRPECVGAGVGRALMEHAIADLRSRGFGDAVLWVLAGNARARRFYAAAGWAPDGAERARAFRIDDEETPAFEIRYTRRL